MIDGVPDLEVEVGERGLVRDRERLHARERVAETARDDALREREDRLVEALGGVDALHETDLEGALRGEHLAGVEQPARHARADELAQRLRGATAADAGRVRVAERRGRGG